MSKEYFHKAQSLNDLQCAKLALFFGIASKRVKNIKKNEKTNCRTVLFLEGCAIFALSLGEPKCRWTEYGK